MRFKSPLAALIAVSAFSLLLPATASAWSGHHYNENSAADPYAYQYEPRGYYPYYRSDYWRHPSEVRNRRFRFHQPPYFRAWGLHKYEHVERRYHEGHRYRKHQY